MVTAALIRIKIEGHAVTITESDKAEKASGGVSSST